MLKQLTVRNVSLVTFLDIRFEAGLPVITGESGAGKSILLGALGLVLGERASADIVRPGTDRADVTAEFDLSRSERCTNALKEQELIDMDAPERCLVRRVVSADGRSRAFVNGTPVTLTVLRETVDGLVDIHGQDENQRLANRAVQLDLLDDFGVAAKDLTGMHRSYHAWQNASAAASRLAQSLTSAADRRALLEYQLQELDDLALFDGEFETLKAEFKRSSSVHQIIETVRTVGEALEELGSLRQAHKLLETIDDDHPALVAARDAMLTAVEITDDVSRDLRDYEDTLEINPEKLLECEARLDLIHDLARKHRVRPEALPAHHVSLRAELSTLSSNEGNLADLQAEMEKQRKDFLATAKKVSTQRRTSADTFCTQVSTAMNTLGIKGGNLAVAFNPRESEHGLEDIEFLITTNPKYPQAPLNRIASGGERARISLAIQIVAAEKTALPCLVLDEADVGVGGTAADIIGRLLKNLGVHTQVICVTHAPQVAALGEHHMQVSKNADQDTWITTLETPARIDELARMLAGANITDKTRDYAQTLLDEAGNPTVH
ncbi:MAG: DNA repair protein RecN [Proteobacteria bacterium]|nr:DNA repair protein RecN [Pseudomonadota bacterium]